jgi:hypothetical protein
LQLNIRKYNKKSYYKEKLSTLLEFGTLTGGASHSKVSADKTPVRLPEMPIDLML